jgi:multicomponent Na+:H+ antiporter subunit F
VIDLLWAVGMALLLLGFASLWRVDRGPTIQDRILAVNVAGSKTLVLLVVLATIAGHPFLIDVAIILGLLNLVITLAVTRFIEAGRLTSESPDAAGTR